LGSNKAFTHTNIQKILSDQIGVAYDSVGETPETGFSPIGLLNYVGKKLGSRTYCSTTEEAWKTAGLLIKTSYGHFETGDILFFKLYSKSKQKDELFLTMVLDNKHMIYSSFGKKMVIKVSFKTDFWEERFVGARRVILKK